VTEKIDNIKTPNDDSELIGKVKQVNADSRATVVCSDGEERDCEIRNIEAIISDNQFVLVSLREWSTEDKADIEYRYEKSEIEELRKQHNDFEFIGQEDSQIQ
jgi:initiation factor 1A